MAPTILLTRPAAQSARFAKALHDRFGPVPVVMARLTETRFLDTPLPDRPQGVIFTSETGVRALHRLAPDLGGAAWCVGDRTAEIATEAGFAAVSAHGDAAALIAMIRASGVRGPLLHARGRHSRGEVAETLTSAGIETHSVILYDQAECPLGEEGQAVLGGKAPVLLPIFSPRTARLLVAQAAGAQAPLHVVALSQAVAEGVSGLPAETLTIASRPDAQAMIDALAQRLAAVRPA
ncbi:uroporphyrinogen-III synthase [Acidimangrovimonas sediminis]|uniref:uroporphyrinogen-III synthase n=1 Tax=Acidimangrovimonas sediminis TaxID=2056283 RepID=UPI000C80EE5A|nr:uroporphyrinogen-III synthase [Acidimangrovimonas sediminis]